MHIQEFDVFVIGSGTAGQTVAKICAKNGLTVAIADRREYGGTCANRGCDPKKVFFSATETLDRSKKLAKKGILDKPQLHWKKLQQFKKTFTSAVPAGTESQLSGLGIQLYHQSPIFIDKNTLTVEGKTLKVGKIVIATGLVPKPLDFKGSDYLKTSDHFLKLKKIPKSMVFIGAGYIAMEFAHMAARAGSNVCILDHEKRSLKSFDPDLVAHLQNASEDLGIQFLFNSEVKSIEKLRKNLRIGYQKDGKESSLKTKLVFNTTGRVPAVEELKLEKANVAFSKKGINVNAYLQSTTNPNVYACGDISNKGKPLTPLSGIEALIVAENILHGNTKKTATALIPSAVFTLPNIASVGLSEKQARSKFKDILVQYDFVPAWFNAAQMNASTYAYKIISNKRTKKIVGAHIVSPNAAETINIFVMAIKNGMTTDALKKMIFTYPTWVNDIKSMV